MRSTFRSGRHLALGAGLLGLLLSTAACNKLGGSGDFAKTKSGIEYKIFKKVGSKYERRDITGDADPTYKTRVGKFLTAYIDTRTGKDSVLESTRTKFQGAVVPLPLQEVKRKGNPDEAFALLQPGDSAVFRFNADSLFKPQGRPVPPFLKKAGNVVVLHVATRALIDQPAAMAMQQELQQKMMAEQQRQMMAFAGDQLKKDDAALQAYAKAKNLTGLKKTPSGIYYLITAPGAGPAAKQGQTVTMKYTGSLLDGKVFDSSDKHPDPPFSFPLGQGKVIPGWDEAVALLNKGSKATFLIPSTLAYGQQGAGADIPANSPLRFEVELMDVK